MKTYKLDSGKVVKITGWSDADEKAYQKLLKRRQAATKKAVGQIGDVVEQFADEFAEALADDYRAADAWEDFLAKSSPEEVLGQIDYWNFGS